MADTIYERINRTLSWKRIVTFNLVLFLVLIVPISVRLAQQDTENRSSAAGTPEPSVIPPVNYPSAPPHIDRVSLFFGKPGDTVVILGTNFGDYQWGSKVYVGNVEAPSDGVVRWSNSVLEVKIPEAARTGKVWVTVNGQQSEWDGSLLLYDVAHAAQVGLQKMATGSANVFVINGTGASRGMIQIGFVSEPVTFTPAAGVKVEAQDVGADNLGKKITIEYALDFPLPSGRMVLGTLNYPGIGTLEILQAKLYDTNGGLISLFSDPLSQKIN